VQKSHQIGYDLSLLDETAMRINDEEDWHSLISKSMKSLLQEIRSMFL